MDSRERLGGDARRALVVRLEARRAEIEEATLTRVRAVSGPAAAVAPEYAQGLHTAVSAAVDLGLATVAGGDGAAPKIPTPLLAQARLAARHRVGLGTVLRRYSVGYSLLGQLVAEEAEREGLGSGGISRLLEVEAMIFDQVVEAVTEEYERERVRPASVDGRRLELVKGLLGGAFVDTAALAYDFDRHHVAVLARGVDALRAVEDLARVLGCRQLTVSPGEGTTWAWLGRGDPPPLDRLSACPPALGCRACVAIGEAGEGMTGWRQSYRQASAAFAIAARRPGVLVRYRDVALITSIAQDDLLARSLRELYLLPLNAGRDGDALIETLRAYFVAGRNSASAAAALEVSRQTVHYRLRTVEERVGQPLAACAAEVEAALGLHELDRSAPTHLADVRYGGPPVDE